MNKQHRTNLVLLLVVTFGAVACLSSILHLTLAQLDVRFWLLAVVTVGCSSRLIVRIPRVKGEITVSDTLIFLTLLLYGSEAAVLLAATEGLVSSLRVSKKVRTYLFNTAMLACSTFLTGWVVLFCFGPTVRVTHGDFSAHFIMMVCTMALVQYLANAGLAAVYSAMRSNQAILYTWTNGFLWTSITYFAGASAAGIIVKLSGAVSIYAFIVTTPIIAVVYFTYRTYLKSFEASQAQAEQAQRYVEELSDHIAEQERISKALKESEEHFRSAFDQAAGMALVTLDGHWRQVNQSLCRILGYSEQEMLATSFQEITHPDDLGQDLTFLYHLVEGKVPTSQTEKRYTHKSGSEVWVLQSASLVRDTEGKPQHLIFQIQDITERKQAEERIHHAAFHDALTRLPNRILLIDRLSLAVERAKRHRDYQFAMLFIDLDRFKIVNDSLGHQFGDQLLIEASHRLQQCVRVVDTVARLGGDEFAILLDGIEGTETAAPTAERIQKQLTTPFSLNGQEVFISASIGIAFSTTGYDRPEDILRDSDTAMYRAKANGKARHEIFDQAMHTRAMEQLQLENDLRRAVERQEFEVYYQPIISLEDGHCSGFEALIRWQHPQRGLVSPAEFIPLAEETGLIIPLGLTVLREACRQTVTWQEQFPAEQPFTISVNLSAKQLRQHDLVEQIERILRETRLRPDCLRLEITESLVMENAEIAAQILRELKTLGLKLSLDDFGTGYSSLSYLHRFPFDILKIDRSFVMHMEQDQGGTKIVKTILMLASELGMAVVAEGIETEYQQDQLRAMHCAYGQGYFFSRPVMASAIEPLLLKQMAQPTNSSLDEAYQPRKWKSMSSTYSM